jgi:signal transduction histidine kinase
MDATIFTMDGTALHKTLSAVLKTCFDPRSTDRDESFRERVIRTTLAIMIVGIASGLVETIVAYHELWSPTFMICTVGLLLCLLVGIAVSTRHIILAGAIEVFMILLAGYWMMTQGGSPAAVLMLAVAVTSVVLPRAAILPSAGLCLIVLYLPTPNPVPNTYNALAQGLYGFEFLLFLEGLFLRQLRGEFDKRLAEVHHAIHTLENTQRQLQWLSEQERLLMPHDIPPALVEKVAHLLGVSYAALRLKQDEQLVSHAEYGTPKGELVHLPLLYQAEMVGELILASHPAGQPALDKNSYLFHELTRQVGIALHAVRMSTALQQSRERLVMAQEEERRRIRRDLHDGLGPVLASFILQLDTVRNLLEWDRETAEKVLGDMKTQVRQAITDIRSLVYALRPPALDDLGLIPALNEHIMHYNQGNGCKITLDTPNEIPPLGAALEVTVYRITLEALTNVTRHAQARKCHVRLTLTHCLNLEISDDGCGLPPYYKAGVGITSMRERVAELGGHLSLGQGSVSGTCLFVQLPVS